MVRILDGASISLDRQLYMLRVLNSKGGLTFDQLHFKMFWAHGVTDTWLRKQLHKCMKWGLIEQRGTKFHVDEEKYELVMKARAESENVIIPE